MRRLIAAAMAAALMCGAARAAPLEAYGKLPNIEQVELSPSGRQIALIATDGDARTVIVQSLPDRKTTFAGRAGDLRVRAIQWAGEDHLLMTIATTKRPIDVDSPKVEYLMAQDINLKTGKVQGLMEDVHVGGDGRAFVSTFDVVLSPPSVRIIDGKPVAFVRGIYFPVDVGVVALFRVDLDTDRAQLIQKGFGGGAYDWLQDADGKILAEADYVGRTGAWTLRLRSGSSGWRTVQRQTSRYETPDLVGLTQDGNAVLVDVGDQESGSAWTQLSLTAGEWTEPTRNATITLPVNDPVTHRVIGSYALVGDKPEYTFFQPHDAAVWAAIQKAFPGDLVMLASWSADRKKIVVRVDSAELGPAYALVDLDTGSADWLGAEYAALKAADISPRQAIRYRASDGLEITGYLTLPQGRAPDGLSLVVLAHGGPAARDAPGFDWWAQALASRGYAVLQANFRGSNGLGWGFKEAGFGQFGRKMQTDLSDGVRYLAAQGVVDPKRVCIVGGSYGGYAALAGATLDRGVYRCAVSYAGMSDLVMDLIDSKKKSGESAERYWLRYIGAKDADDPVMRAVSPAYQAAQADIPILLIHGTDDTNVEYKQSQRMAEALQRAGKSVEFVTLKGEDHSMSSGATRLQMLQASVAFLAKYNPPN